MCVWVCVCWALPSDGAAAWRTLLTSMQTMAKLCSKTEERRGSTSEDRRPKSLGLWLLATLSVWLFGAAVTSNCWQNNCVRLVVVSHTHAHTHLDSLFGKCLFEWANWNKNWPNYIMSLSWRQFYNSANTRAQHLLAGCQQQRAEQSVCVCII